MTISSSHVLSDYIYELKGTSNTDISEKFKKTEREIFKYLEKVFRYEYCHKRQKGISLTNDESSKSLKYGIFITFDLLSKTRGGTISTNLLMMMTKTFDLAC